MSSEGDKNVQIGPDLNPSRSPLDKKLYRQILLPNGLRCVLISDTVAMRQRENLVYDDDDDDYEDESEEEQLADNEEYDDESFEEEGDGLRKAAAAMVVGVGSYYDPPHVQGLAHFLEHMLFMGTAKFPTENAYDSFLSSNGGSDNAYTELEYTLYHFEIPQEKFFEALDMFAQFFIDPLLLPDAVDRELNAIESEFQLNKNSDGSRHCELLCYTGHSVNDHPFGTFSWGDLRSLRDTPSRNGVDVLKELRQFYDQYYYAANQKLVVVGAYTLDELQSQVVNCFSQIPSMPRVQQRLEILNHNPNSWEATYISPIRKFGYPFPERSMRRLYRIIPINERHSLSIIWQLPPSCDSEWKSKPTDIISHLLGHESKGSLLSALKEKSWATGCEAGISSSGHYNASSHRLFYVSFVLSEDGVKFYNEIISYVYQYIGMLHYHCLSEEGIPQYIFDEIKSVHDVSYKFDDEPSPEDLVESIAEDLVPVPYTMPPERLLDGHSLYFEFDQNSIREILAEFLKPEHARIDIISSLFNTSDVDNFEPTPEQCRDQLVLNMCAHVDNEGYAHEFGTSNCGSPQIEPMFGTKFWCHRIDPRFIKKWENYAAPQLPSESSLLSLPPINPFVPNNFQMKPLPKEDSHHPMLHCSFKVCVTIGKSKIWLPATATKFNETNKSMLLVYEDEQELWHVIDESVEGSHKLSVGYEGTFDSKKSKYRITALPSEKGAILRFGDDTDFDVEDGIAFPPIPPPLPSSRLPQKIADEKGLKMWFLQDRKFNRPIAELRMRFVCMNANKSPLHKACQDLFVSLCGDAMLETAYLAGVCELYSSIRSTDVGFSIRIHGFDDKLLQLAQNTISTCLTFRGNHGLKSLPHILKNDRFEACLEVLRRKYKNSSMKSSSQVTDMRLFCIRKDCWSPFAKLNALQSISIELFNNIVSENLNSITIEALFHGNVSENDALSAKSMIISAMINSGSIGFPIRHWPYQQVAKIPATIDNNFLIAASNEITEPNTAVEVYFQIKEDDNRTRTIIDLISHMMYEPLFDQLRTKEQFGYQVSCGARWTFGVIGLSFKVVTSSKSSLEVVNRIETFLSDYRSELEQMSAEKFLEQLVGLAKNKLEMHNSLDEECSSYWEQIIERRYEWEQSRNEAIELRSITKLEVIKCFDQWFNPVTLNSIKNKRRRLVVQVIGNGDGPSSSGRPEITDNETQRASDDAVKKIHLEIGNNFWEKIC